MLRDKLLEITLDPAVADHPNRVAQLVAEVAHTILLRDSAHPLDRYTCGVHAFHLVEDPDYVQVATTGLGSTFAGPEFIEFLLTHELLEPRKDGEQQADDLVIYFEGGVFRHVGRLLEDGRVISKWGTGCLWEHQVWEVPRSYGDEVRFFVGPDEQQSYDLFVKFAESKGFEFGQPEV